MIKRAAPYFEEWTLAQLQSEVRKYGLKPVRTRQVMIDHLRTVHQLLPDAEPPSPSPSAAPVSGDEGEAGDTTLQLEAEAGSDYASSSDVPLAKGVDMTPQRLASLVKADVQFWTRILRYEPIAFDEFVSLAHKAGIKVDTGRKKEELRAWLDRQSICFYTAELTGARSRH